MNTLTPCIAAFCLLLSTTASADPKGEVRVPILLKAADLTLQAGQNGLRPNLPGYSPIGKPGLPALPARNLHVALPPEAQLDSLQLSSRPLGQAVELPLSGRSLKTAPSPYLLCAKPGTCPAVAVEPVVQRRPAADGPFRLLSVGRIGPQIMASIEHRPVRLNPSGDGLIFQAQSELVIHFSRRKLKGPTPKTSGWQGRLARRLAVNPAELERDYPLRKGFFEGSLAILTTEAVVEASAELADFIAAHEEQGMRVELVTESDLDALTGQAPDERPQRMRAWLQQNIDALDLEAVLIIGNPDPSHTELPMLAAKVFRDGENEYVAETPTDAFYSDLNGNWDLDGDGRYGEWGDDAGPTGVDFYPELACGRIPYYGDTSALDKILSRTATYLRARQNTTWRKRILFPAAVLFFPDRFMTPRMEGGDVSEKMKPEFTEAGFATTTLYEKAGLNGTLYEPDLPLTEDEMIREWNEGYGLVYWFGHGSEDAAWRTIWVKDANNNLQPDPYEMGGAAFAQSIHHERLPSDRPAIVFHGSCSNGTPENAANIGYTQLKSGAIASYSSTRVAYGATGVDWEPSLDHCDIFMMGYYVVSALRDGTPAGEALASVRASLGDGSGWGNISWHSKMATSLYGDPSLSLASCSTDSDCDDGLPCNGVETCADNLCMPGQPVDCSDQDSPCSLGQCQPDSGACALITLDGQDCDDGKFCTVFDSCTQDACAGRPRACQTQAICHVGRCDEEARACVAEPLPDDSGCQTIDGQVGTCQQGLCLTETDGCSCGAGLPGHLGLLLLMLLGLGRASGQGRRSEKSLGGDLR